MSRQTITLHMVVKNEDQWVGYALRSVLPYVDRCLIADTGSTDDTVSIIHSISDPKITFITSPVTNARDLVKVRAQQLEATNTEWIWMVDGDEIYPQALTKEIVAHLSPALSGVVVRRYDCLGDIYHYQPNERVGGYTMFGVTAHYSLRLINRRILGLHLAGDYPNEGFVDQANKRLIDYPKNAFYITRERYLHATYLKRSSLGTNLNDTLHRHKFKYELGKEIPKNLVPHLPAGRSPAYQLYAAVLTPLKVLKRKLL